MGKGGAGTSYASKRQNQIFRHDERNDNSNSNNNSGFHRAGSPSNNSRSKFTEELEAHRLFRKVPKKFTFNHVNVTETPMPKPVQLEPLQQQPYKNRNGNKFTFSSSHIGNVQAPVSPERPSEASKSLDMLAVPSPKHKSPFQEKQTNDFDADLQNQLDSQSQSQSAFSVSAGGESLLSAINDSVAHQQVHGATIDRIPSSDSLKENGPLKDKPKSQMQPSAPQASPLTTKHVHRQQKEFDVDLQHQPDSNSNSVFSFSVTVGESSSSVGGPILPRKSPEENGRCQKTPHQSTSPEPHKSLKQDTEEKEFDVDLQQQPDNHSNPAFSFSVNVGESSSSVDGAAALHYQGGPVLPSKSTKDNGLFEKKSPQQHLQPPHHEEKMTTIAVESKQTSDFDAELQQQPDSQSNSEFSLGINTENHSPPVAASGGSETSQHQQLHHHKNTPRNDSEKDDTKKKSESQQLEIPRNTPPPYPHKRQTSPLRLPLVETVTSPIAHNAVVQHKRCNITPDDLEQLRKSQDEEDGVDVQMKGDIGPTERKERTIEEQQQPNAMRNLLMAEERKRKLAEQDIRSLDDMLRSNDEEEDLFGDKRTNNIDLSEMSSCSSIGKDPSLNGLNEIMGAISDLSGQDDNQSTDTGRRTLQSEGAVFMEPGEESLRAAPSDEMENRGSEVMSAIASEFEDADDLVQPHQEINTVPSDETPQNEFNSSFARNNSTTNYAANNKTNATTLPISKTVLNALSGEDGHSQLNPTVLSPKDVYHRLMELVSLDTQSHMASTIVLNSSQSEERLLELLDDDETSTEETFLGKETDEATNNSSLVLLSTISLAVPNSYDRTGVECMSPTPETVASWQSFPQTEFSKLVAQSHQNSSSITETIIEQSMTPQTAELVPRHMGGIRDDGLSTARCRSAMERIKQENCSPVDSTAARIECSHCVPDNTKTVVVTTQVVDTAASRFCSPADSTAARIGCSPQLSAATRFCSPADSTAARIGCSPHRDVFSLDCTRPDDTTTANEKATTTEIAQVVDTATTREMHFSTTLPTVAEHQPQAAPTSTQDASTLGHRVVVEEGSGEESSELTEEEPEEENNLCDVINWCTPPVVCATNTTTTNTTASASSVANVFTSWCTQSMAHTATLTNSPHHPLPSTTSSATTAQHANKNGMVVMVSPRRRQPKSPQQRNTPRASPMRSSRIKQEKEQFGFAEVYPSPRKLV